MRIYTYFFSEPDQTVPFFELFEHDGDADAQREAPNILAHEPRGSELEIWEGNRRVLKLARRLPYRRSLRLLQRG